METKFKGYTISLEGRVYNKKGRESKISINTTGYSQVWLGKLFSLHRVVFEAFNGAIGDGMVVNHIDGDITNNNLSNLEQCTQYDNIMKGKCNRYNLPKGITKVDSGTRYQFTHKRKYKFSSTDLDKVLTFKKDYDRGHKTSK